MYSNKEDEVLKKAARDIVRVEKRCFYGAEPERDRLKKIRELIDLVSKEVDGDN